ncbi:MAG: hypothetical protein IPH28_23145 [Cytophagaceae bacterium]|nr:hypothetical protein [Cytophagaceae bacterium]
MKNRFGKNFSNEKIEKLQVNTSGGGIKVAGTDSKAQVRVFVRKNNTTCREIKKLKMNLTVISLMGFSEGTKFVRPNLVDLSQEVTSFHGIRSRCT